MTLMHIVHCSRHRRFSIEPLERRLLLTGCSSLADEPHEFVLDDWDYEVTQNDFGVNYFGGGNSTLGDTAAALSVDSSSPDGYSLQLTAGADVLGGYATDLFKRNVVDVTLEPSQAPQPVDVPGSFLDLTDIYNGFGTFVGHDVEKLLFDIKQELGDDLTIRVELKDEAQALATATVVAGTAESWQTCSLAIPDAFSTDASFRWDQVAELVLALEANQNPTSWSFLLDDIRLVDTDGQYPIWDAIAERRFGLPPELRDGFLDLIRQTSAQYFVDAASGFPDTGGIVQDRLTFPDLLTVGGVGFQLSSYVVSAERGYLDRTEAASRTRDILQLLGDEQKMGPEPMGNIGHEGFFYHFLGTDGLRKQNAGAVDTIELSTIDTALALAGVVTAGQYFDGAGQDELSIRQLAEEIYGRVNWPFMLFDQPGHQNDQQFFLSWKPETGDGAHQYARTGQPGRFSGSADDPQTLDFYTDEGLLVALLAMASPNPAHRVGQEVWNAMVRQDEGGSLVKTSSGSLFTYEFASVWLDTNRLGIDNHPTRPVNFWENTRLAIGATKRYTRENPNERATWNSSGLWGLSATEGPFDSYFPEAAPSAAIHPSGLPPTGMVFGAGKPRQLEAESGTGQSLSPDRDNASGGTTARFNVDGQVGRLPFVLDSTTPAIYEMKVRYSNDGLPDTLQLSLDGVPLGDPFTTTDTRPVGGSVGSGWNEFAKTDPVAVTMMVPGQHELEINVIDTDDRGVEIDYVQLQSISAERPLELGTVTNYALGTSIVHVPSSAIGALWHSARLDLNGDRTPDLFHPRFGLADAYNLDIADALIPEVVDCTDPRFLRCAGPWANHTGFAIDHGPMLIMIDNYLEDQFIPNLFMSHPTIDTALRQLFLFSGSGLLGDVNRDNVIDAKDLDLLFAKGGETPDIGCDLNVDGFVDRKDVDFLLEDILGTVHGDVNLDRKVTNADFGIVLGNFGKVGVGWAGGDINFSGAVGNSEFGIILGYFGFGTSLVG